jgi:tetratricopeptide (TPR) repeat protein
MKESKFNVLIEDIASYEWEKEVQGITKKNFFKFSQRFSVISKTLLEKGDKKGSDFYQLLSAVTSLSLNNDDPDAPFHPRPSPEGRYTAIEDFVEEDIKFFEKLVDLSQNPMMKARLADVVFVKSNNYEYAKIASENYLKLLEKNDEEEFLYLESIAKRGFFLSRFFGKKNELFTDYFNKIQQLIDQIIQTEQNNIPLKFINILIEMNVDKTECSKYIDLCTGVAERLEKNKDYNMAENYYDVVIKLLYSCNDQEDIKKVYNRKGECLVNAAHSWLNDTHQGYILASRSLAKAIECFRRAGAPEETINNHHKTLRDWQKTSVEGFPLFSEGMNITEFAQSNRDKVKGKSLSEAIFVFSFGTEIINKDTIEKNVGENIKKFPLLNLFSSSYISSDGKVIEQKPSIMSDNPEKRNEALEALMFQDIRLSFQLRALGFIEPCRQIICSEHRPSLNDLLFLVSDNPFVPQGHETIFLRGIHAGFNGDFIVASHLLVPQIEESIRHVLQSNGFITSNLYSDMTQNEKLSGTLLSRKETIDIFGEDLVFELRGLMLENSCFAFRNRLAHGFISANECYSFAAYNLWWIVVRLCAHPVFACLNKNKEES